MEKEETETEEKEKTATETDAKAAKAQDPAQKQPKSGSRSDRKEMFLRLLVRRLALCAVVALVALVVWRVRHSNPQGATDAPKPAATPIPAW